MGFRSTFTTSETYIKIPAWFLEKYKGTIRTQTCFAYNDKGERTDETFESAPISSSAEYKMYGVYADLLDDLVLVLKEQEKGFSKYMYIAILHEDGTHEVYTLTDEGKYVFGASKTAV